MLVGGFCGVSVFLLCWFVFLVVAVVFEGGVEALGGRRGWGFGVGGVLVPSVFVLGWGFANMGVSTSWGAPKMVVSLLVST